MSVVCNYVLASSFLAVNGLIKSTWYMHPISSTDHSIGVILLAWVVLGILLVWKLSGEHMNVAGPMTRRAEFFYWSVILFSNTLGTALGDFMSDSLEWGYAMSAGIVGGILGL